MIETRIQQQEQLQTETIDQYYSVPNEIDFVKKMEGLEPEEQKHYLRENVLGFLGEFVGKVPYKKISYVLKPDGLDYAGVHVMNSYNATAKQAGAGSRDWCETQGMQAVETALLKSNADTATALSPPKFADYGFAFHFEKGQHDNRLGGIPITEYILRYVEKRGSVRNTESIATSIHPEEAVYETYQTANDYLQTPLLSQGNQESTKESLLKALNIDMSVIQQSEQFEHIIQHDMRDWIDRYVMRVQEVSSFGRRPTLEEIQDLEFMMNAMYNRAQDIKASLDTGTYALRRKLPKGSTVVVDHYDEQLWHMYGSQEALVVGGGSCPVTGKSSYFDANSVLTKLNDGMTMGDMLDEETAWEYHTGNCIHCKAKNVSVGPCNICKECEKVLD